MGKDISFERGMNKVYILALCPAPSALPKEAPFVTSNSPYVATFAHDVETTLAVQDIESKLY